MLHKKTAFSLLELSITLLIIGLLVAGVVGGNKLVKLAAITRAVNLTNTSPVLASEDLIVWLEPTSKKSFLTVGTVANQASIGTWNDINPQSNNKCDATQATSGYRPLYAENAINNLPALAYDVTNDDQRLKCTNISSGNELTTFVVIKWQASHGVNSEVYSLLGEEVAIDTEGNIRSYFWDEQSGTTGFLSSLAPLTANKPVIIARRYDPKNHRADLYLNGTLQANTTSTGNYIFYNQSELTIGNHSAAPRTFGGNIGEIIAFNRILTDIERQNIEDYLSKKWSITLS
jgi:prepilin-type N-terminal cleavage/methylation domain-containing protein